MAKPVGFPLNSNTFSGGSNLTNDESAASLARLLNTVVNFFEDEIDGIGGMGSITLISGAVGTVYGTIAEALAAAVSGDVVALAPGVYAESIVIPDGVGIVGTHGSLHTKIVGAGPTGTRVALGDNSTLIGVYVELPTDAVGAVVYSGSVAARIEQIQLEGRGPAGTGIINSGTGILTVHQVDYNAGDAFSVLTVTDGELNANDIVVSTTGGAINHALAATGGTLNLDGALLEPSGINHAIHVGAAKVRGHGIDIRNAGVAVHVNDAAADVRIAGFRAVDIATNQVLLIDTGLGAGPAVTLQGEFPRDQVNYPATYDKITLSYIDTTPGDEALVIDGELAVGRPETGHEAVFGEGDSYTRGMKVLTTDGTAGPTSDGAGFQDASAVAAGKDGSTFSFQGLTAGHSILFGSTLDGAADKLKYWGIKIATVLGLTSATSKPVVFEIWDGAAWVIKDLMATHASLFHRYGNDILRRPNSSEHMRFGISESTTWVKKDIAGDNIYWARLRVINTLTQAPTFDQFKLSTSRTEINADGTITTHGKARWRQSLFSNFAGYGEGGGVANSAYQVGTGGGDGQWTHRSLNTLCNGNGDRLTNAFILPRGICTSCPLTIRLTVRPTGIAPDAVIKVGVKVQPIVGVDVADPAGGITPIPRTAANTPSVTATAGQSITLNPNFTVANRPYQLVATPFRVADFYEGDLVYVSFEFDDDGASNIDCHFVTAEIEGVSWTPGGKY